MNTFFVESPFYADSLKDISEVDWGGKGWYFWDELGFIAYGPYSCKEEAKRELEKYCKEVLR